MCAPRASASTSSGWAYSRSIRSRTRRSRARSRRCCTMYASRGGIRSLVVSGSAVHTIKILMDGGDTAITQDLSTEETLQLASGAAMQEFALAQVAERARPQSGYQLTVDAIRQPIFSAIDRPRLESPTLDAVDLVEVNAARPLSDLTEEQQRIMADQCIREETSA